MQASGKPPPAAEAELAEYGGLPPDAKLVARASAALGRRVVPVFLALSFTGMLTRANLAFAALSYNRDNAFNARVFSTGAALFFVTFGLFQVPSNVVMARVGFRAWLAILLVVWSLVSAAFVFATRAWSFYLLRLLLGVVQAGSFPAMWHAIAVLFPRKDVTKPYAYLTIGMMLASALGAPLATGFLAMDGLGGLKGWQWLFLLEGLPPLLLAGPVLWLVPDSVEAATFLSPQEREALAAEIARGRAAGAAGAAPPPPLLGALLRAALANGYFWVCCAAGLLVSVPSNFYMVYTPVIISNLMRGTALSNAATVAAGGPASASAAASSAAAGAAGLLPVALSVIPFALAAAASYAVAASSQRADEVIYHVAAPLAVSGAALAAFPPLARASPAAGFAALTVSLALSVAGNGPAITLLARLCDGPQQVVAMPLFSTFSVLGGVAGPLIAGALLPRAGGFTWVAELMAGLLIATALLALLLRVALHANGQLDLTRSRSVAALDRSSGGSSSSGGQSRHSSLDSAFRGGGTGRPAPGPKPAGVLSLLRQPRSTHSSPSHSRSAAAAERQVAGVAAVSRPVEGPRPGPAVPPQALPQAGGVNDSDTWLQVDQGVGPGAGARPRR